MQPSIRYVIANDSVLGYITSREPQLCGILRASILRGATHTSMDGFFVLSPTDVLRDATPHDFTSYRVVLPPDFA